MTETDSALEAAAAAAADFIDRTHAALHASTVETLGTLDLTFSQVRMLFVLIQADTPLPVNEVADGVGLSLAAAGRAADRLVADGLVDRREDARDRRIKRLSLTDAGYDLLVNKFRLRTEQLREVLAALPADVLRRLGAALTETAALLPPSPVHGACAVPPRPGTAPR